MGLTIGTVLICIVVLAVYGFIIWLPVMIAQNRDHPKMDGIKMMAVLSLFLPFLWPVAMVWAFVGSTSPEEQRKQRLKAAASFKLPPPKPAPAELDAEIEAATADVCENCGAPIGKLETPQVWKEHVVCSDCHKKLANT